MDVVVQPGVNWVDLNTLLKNSGLFLPLDPSPTVPFPTRACIERSNEFAGIDRRHGRNQLQVSLLLVTSSAAILGPVLKVDI